MGHAECFTNSCLSAMPLPWALFPVQAKLAALWPPASSQGLPVGPSPQGHRLSALWELRL